MADIAAVQAKVKARSALRTKLRRYRAIYVIAALPLLYFLLFRYYPLWNAQIAFKSFDPLVGVWKSSWTGLVNFFTFFRSIYFLELLRNTLMYSLARLLLGIPCALILALALSETSSRRLRGVVQTITYLPHFLSWIIMYGLLITLLSPGDGLINQIIKALGGTPIPFLTSPKAFPYIVILSDIWKETGWSAIIFLAALLGVDPALYEAAAVEGASRFQRIWRITLPLILDVIIVITLLRLANILDAGFQQLFVLYSVPVYSVGDIVDTWVYRQGVLEFQFSLATAVGLFKGVISLVLVVVFNNIARRISDAGGLY